jgi:hypothetical protein
VSRVIKIFQELVEDKPGEFEKRFLYVSFDIIKEQVDEVKKLTICGSGFPAAISPSTKLRVSWQLTAGSKQQKSLLTDWHLRSRWENLLIVAS